MFLDSCGTLGFWGPAFFARFFGLQRDRVIGKDKRELIRAQISNIFENSQEFMDKVISTYNNNTYVPNRKTKRKGKQEKHTCNTAGAPVDNNINKYFRPLFYFKRNRHK